MDVNKPESIIAAVLAMQGNRVSILKSGTTLHIENFKALREIV